MASRSPGQRNSKPRRRTGQARAARRACRACHSRTPAGGRNWLGLAFVPISRYPAAAQGLDWPSASAEREIAPAARAEDGTGTGRPGVPYAGLFAACPLVTGGRRNSSGSTR